MALRGVRTIKLLLDESATRNEIITAFISYANAQIDNTIDSRQLDSLTALNRYPRTSCLPQMSVIEGRGYKSANAIIKR